MAWHIDRLPARCYTRPVFLAACFSGWRQPLPAVLSLEGRPTGQHSALDYFAAWWLEGGAAAHGEYTVRFDTRQGEVQRATAAPARLAGAPAGGSTRIGSRARGGL